MGSSCENICSKNKIQNDDLGVENVVTVLTNFLVTDFKRKNRIQDEFGSRSTRKLHLAAKVAVQTLSSNTQASIHVDSLYDGMDYNFNLSRGRFEDLVKNILTKVLSNIPSETSHLFLLGGGANIPLFQKL